MQSIRKIYKIGRGPSSSHTIGPESAAKIFLARYPAADRFTVSLFGSLSKTGRGHGTDRVLREVFSPAETEVIFREDRPEGVQHPNTLLFEAWQDETRLGQMWAESIGGGDIRIPGEPLPEADEEIYPENSYAEVEQQCRLWNCSLDEYVEANEGTEIWAFLAEIWEAMNCSIREGLAAEGILPGGLNVARKAKLLNEEPAPDESPELQQVRLVSAYAFAVCEQNADCGTIVTAPTCGACGILPAVLRYMQDRYGLTDGQTVRALGVAGLFGNLVKQNASISGAECGCQAEVGTACSMAAAAAAHLMGLNMHQIQYAAEIAMEHHLGLTCDPICGLVQVPCIERNAVAAMRAISACNLAYYLHDTQRISFDMVVKTMYETGVSMNQRFRETAEGGLAKMFSRRRRM
ncbi:MAG: L-serine ammonia-lyase, iron-sulfur-dependent, subunit alpha [Oscillospiraceae bacterium]|nr:L-serine ammonia-lyase, iron-sulfur-dependent, subunit alpha [Oscillospiraceae bacterium]